LKTLNYERRDINRDEDWAEYLTSIIKEKDRLLQEKTIETNRLTQRDSEHQLILNKFQLIKHHAHKQTEPYCQHPVANNPRDRRYDTRAEELLVSE